MLLNKIFVKEPSDTEQEILRLKEMRKQYDPTDEEYRRINGCLKELYELKNMENKPKMQVSGDTIVKAAALAGVICLIVFREELVGPVTSKALSLATKFAAV